MGLVEAVVEGGERPFERTPPVFEGMVRYSMPLKPNTAPRRGGSLANCSRFVQNVL